MRRRNNETLELNLDDEPVVIRRTRALSLRKVIDFIKAIPNGKFYTGEGIAKLRISRNALLPIPSQSGIASSSSSFTNVYKSAVSVSHHNQ